MKVVAGLGNPGKKYAHTRHNIGWLALDYVLRGLGASGEQEKFKAIIKEFLPPAGEKVLFVYPQTSMNNSGAAVLDILNFYKLTPKDLLVVQDEVDLPLGTVRVSQNSSSAGHNGVQSIIDALVTNEFKRVRIGVETRADKAVPPTHDFVLQEFPPEELAQIPFEEIQEKILEHIK